MKNLAPKIKSNLDTNSEEFSHNKEMMLDKISFLDELLDKAKVGGGTHHHERLAKRGKMPVRERVFNLLIPTHHFLKLHHLLPMGPNLLLGVVVYVA